MFALFYSCRKTLMVLLCCLFIVYYFSRCLWGFVVKSLFCFAVLCVLSSFTIISLGKRELVALLLLSSLCLVTDFVLCLFLMLLWVGLQFLTLAVPGHTH